MTAEGEKKSQEQAHIPEKSIFEGLEGVYRGFSPTDESAVIMGEMELTITKEAIKIRMATGLKIREEDLTVEDSGLSEMSADEISGLFDNPNADTQGVRAFKVNDEPLLVFAREKEDGVTVRMYAGIAEYLGPTVFFNPQQVERGLFEKAVQEIEQSFGRTGVLPRLSNNGKALS